MGLLDEAIREHLELKRRHGADPTDVARAEREALGPAVRESVPGAAGGQVATAEAEAPEAVTELAPEPAEAESEPASEPAPDVAPTAAEPPVEEPVPEQATAVFDADEIFAEEDAAALAPRPAEHEDPDAPPPGAGSHPSDETAAAGAGDDVLEETPEFLQETPEHDRLWFEQKPPRDFDFDK
jgi:hypothetical protein